MDGEEFRVGWVAIPNENLFPAKSSSSRGILYFPPTPCTCQQDVVLFSRFRSGKKAISGMRRVRRSSTVPSIPRKRLIFNIPAGIQPPGRSPLWQGALVGRAVTRRRATQICRAHGCVPTADVTQQRIVALSERPLI